VLTRLRGAGRVGKGGSWGCDVVTELLRRRFLDCWWGFVVGSEGYELSIELLGVGALFYVQRPRKLECMVSHLVDG
jgi:hypothetical protein